MRRICWWLAELVSTLLEPDEREAVCGDFEEAGEAGGRALCEIVGLVANRQADLCKDWRPWLALVGLIAPFGVLLTVVFWQLSALSAIYTWMYLDNWRMADIWNPGFRHVLAECILAAFINYMALIGWSWTTGFVLGSLSHRRIRTNGVLFFVVLFGEFFAELHYHGDVNDPIFSLTFYRVVLPLILRTVLILVPSLLGMRAGLRLGTLQMSHAVILTAAIASLTALMIWRDGWWQLRSVWQIWLLTVAAYWPLGYTFATSMLAGRYGKAREV
jgi:hypothetical protein